MIFRRIFLNTCETFVVQKQSLTLSISGRADYFTAQSSTSTQLLDTHFILFYTEDEKSDWNYLETQKNGRSLISQVTAHTKPLNGIHTTGVIQCQIHYWAYSHFESLKNIIKRSYPTKIGIDVQLS